MKKLTSLQNPVVKHLVKLRKEARYRKECGSVVIDGKKLVEDVCQKKSAKLLLCLEGTDIPDFLCAEELYIVTQEILDKISGAKSTDQMLAEVEVPKESQFKELHRLIVLDRISDPGNMGTLFRTAFAFGWEALFIIDGSCDPLNDKALRAAKGATFKLPYIIGSWKELQKVVSEQELVVYAADIQGDPLETVSYPERLALVLGNEASGLSDQAKKLSKMVTIPMSKDIESLNVAAAGAILMYAMQHL